MAGKPNRAAGRAPFTFVWAMLKYSNSDKLETSGIVPSMPVWYKELRGVKI
jgi:hypothetical protein